MPTIAIGSSTVRALTTTLREAALSVAPASR
jgi:hypothetical protein